MKNLIALVFVLIGASYTSLAGDPLIITSSSIRESRTIGEFTGLSLKGAMKVVLRLGDNESIRMEGDRTAIENITTKVVENKLEIAQKIHTHPRNINYSKVTIYVVAKRLHSLDLSGSGIINIESLLETSRMNISLNGSGTIHLNGNLDHLNGSIGGSGRINMGGTAKNASIAIKGSGSFNGSSLKTQVLSSSILGSGSITAGVSTRLNATIKGSGSVRYSGDPKISESRLGTGRVRKIA